MAEINGGRLVAKQLKQAGIDTAFGVVAGPMIEVMSGMEREGIKVVNCRHEESACFAASAWGYIKKKPGVVSLPSGLSYEILQPGTGEYPKSTDSVKVHYTGTLIDGTVFDSSVQRNEPAEFLLDQVVPGWTEGLQKINKGGKIKLYVPPHLAYGDDGRPGIPPASTLIFEVELLDFKSPTPPAAKAAAPAPATK